MLREMQEIQSLATKYSKAELGRMVQMGMLDPQKAMMAGMMITRIEQQNAKPPQTTVAQDVLGLPAVASQQPMPEQQMPQEDAGVAALPSGITEMATGGIVAFDEGGEVPGYAGGGDPSWQIDPAVQRYRDMNWRLPILKQELQEAQARGDEESVAAVQRELRALLPKQTADSGITALIPAAQAAEPVTAKPFSAPQASTPFAQGLPSFEMQTERNPLRTPKMAEEEARRKEKLAQQNQAMDAAAVERAQERDKERQRQAIIEAESARRMQLRREGKPVPSGPVEMPANLLPTGTAQTAQEAYPAKAWSDVTNRLGGFTPAGVASLVEPSGAAPEGAAPAGGAAPAEGKAPALPPIARPAVDTSSFEERVAKFTPKVGEMPMTKEKSAEELSAETKAAYAREGYDPEFINKMIAGIEEKKGKAADEKDRAFGEAIMMAGIKLMGARRGQEFQNLSEGAQEGLKNYQSAMKDVRALQEKYDERIETLRAADMQARKTGADSAIARADKLREQVHADQVKLFEAKNEAAKAGVTAAVNSTNADKQMLASMYHSDVAAAASKYTADVHRDYTQALREQGLKDKEIAMIAGLQQKRLAQLQADVKNSAVPAALLEQQAWDYAEKSYRNAQGMVDAPGVPQAPRVGAPAAPLSSFYRQ